MTHECQKSEEINRINKILLGNGKKGMVTYIAELFEKFDSMNKAVETVQADVKVLVQFQTQQEVLNQQENIRKKEIKEKEREFTIKNRWMIVLAVSTIMGLLGMLMSFVIEARQPTQAQVEDKGFPEKEFRELYQKYKEDMKPRSGDFVVNDSIQQTDIIN